MFTTHAWIEAFSELRETALDARGAVVLDLGADPAERWPATLGADVFAIAAVIDPIVRAHAGREDGHALADRWRFVLDDIEGEALRAPLMTFAGNRAFWRTLAAIAVYLSMRDAELPPESIWRALVAQVGERLRNAGPTEPGPFGAFESARTFDDLFLAQRNYLRTLRGEDMLDPDPGQAGPKTAIPRTTHADVIALADYWTKQLDRVKRLPGDGYAGIAARWKAALTDIDTIARRGAPTAVYAKNNAFWRALQATAVHVAVVDEHPSKTEMFLDSLKTSLANLPQNIASGARAIASAASDLAGKAAHGVGNIANQAGRGLFSGFGTPLLIGGGLLGLYLISRSQRGNAAATSTTAGG
ncbi:MAG: hypothetical protein JNL83_17895 [Myxococcales bacterium]|nr:hypothetical protein [Myxococcales bacterium]